MQLVVQAEGIEPRAVEHSEIVSQRKWPWPGTQLPVRIDRADPDRLEVLWDDVPEGVERGKAQAAQIAQALRQQADTAAPPAETQPEGIPPEAAAVVDRLKEVFPGAVVNVQSRTSEGDAGQDADDRLDALERLARLRDSGVLTDEEFDAEKRRILGND